ncbi:PilZ domain-containing protein [uncultured Brachyspira sp.]|uniref:PilZ domain-containing protein n=1 Tax=uncultured Brachyspira sp. TaxID=221953 RepID=UPI0025E5EEB8|nr:PilZ domain-containing protein [uncultured Brachyspira sp.]
MDKVKAVLIESDSNIIEKYKNGLSASFDISTFKDTHSSMSYIIKNNVDIYFYMIRYNEKDENSISFFADKIKDINPQIKLVIIETEDNFNKDKYPYAIVFNNKSEMAHINDILLQYVNNNDSSQRRQYSRVNWPLNVIIAYKDKMRGTMERNILSISGNGAYIRSDINIPSKGEMLGLTISFRDFKLFTEAKVVFINNGTERPNFPKGFAVQFIDIGMASQKIIDQIIRDKLLQEILIEYEDEHFSS